MFYIARFLFFDLLGWKIKGIISPEIKKCVVIVAPHTSWHDFYMGLLVRRLLNVEISYLGKKELFKQPFGWYFKWMGGIAVNRSSSENKVQAISKIFKSRDVFRLALSPEGTRKKVEKWRTGFYFIAKEANVPVICVAFDYGNKKVLISEPLHTTDNSEEDLKKIFQFYKGVTGKIPENFQIG